jgi:HKD family nuclease
MQLILGPANSAIDTIRQIRTGRVIERVTVLVAWARINGVALFLDALGADIRKVGIAVGMAGAATSVEALSYLRAHCAEVHLFHKHHRQTFHPKVYCFDGPGNPPVASHLLVGSSNITGGGLFSNYEASLVSPLAPAASSAEFETWNSVMSAFDSVVSSPFSEHITDDERIQVLLEVQRFRLFGQLPGRNKLKGPGSRLLVSSFPEIKFILSCCGVL